MKEWKSKLVQAILDEIAAAELIYIPAIGWTDRAVKFSDIAQRHGYKHIKRSDIDDILLAVRRRNPELQAVRYVDDPPNRCCRESYYSTVYITDAEEDESKMTLSNLYGDAISIVRTPWDRWRVSEDQGRFEMEFLRLKDALDYAREHGYDQMEDN